MDPVQRALDELRRAEGILRELVADAAGAGRYDAAITVAEWASILRNLGTDRSVAPGTPLDAADQPPPAPTATVHAPASLPVHPTKSKTKTPVRSARAARRAPDAYPRFERRGDDLFKIGSSRSFAAEYEHRAPLAVIHQVVRALEELAADTDVVSTAHLLPVISPTDGREAPPYQVYVVLAWLREAGLIDPVGRQGYRVRSRGTLRQRVDRLWSGAGLRPAAASRL